MFYELQAASTELADEGLAFMKEMLELAQAQQEVISEPRVVQMRFSGTVLISRHRVVYLLTGSQQAGAKTAILVVVQCLPIINGETPITYTHYSIEPDILY